jgi:prephenate dehydrogenase
MGASLALALRKVDDSCRIDGLVRSKKSQLDSEKLNVLNKVYLEEEFLAERNTAKWDQYDLIVFGTPVHLIKKQITYIPVDSIPVLTDMGSTKATILSAVETHFSGCLQHNYVSSHPMCGSENSGPSSAIDDLFVNKLCILSALAHSKPLVMERLERFWSSIGMKTYRMDGVEHDRVLAYLSHSPHIIAALLANWAKESVGEDNSESPQPIMGGGFRDMVRIAGSNPEMWQAILIENKVEIAKSLYKFKDVLSSAIELIETGSPEELTNFFVKAAQDKKQLTEFGK